MRYAGLTQAIRGEDAVARETAMYEMAKLAYELREFYLPCKQIPGPAMPAFMRNPGEHEYGAIRKGVLTLSAFSTQRERRDAIERKPELQDAVDFLGYCHRVSAVESHNESACATLLMSRAWIVQLNPVEDAPAIQLLGNILRSEYRVNEPATSPADRRAQARHHARDYRWLSGAWRGLWGRP